MPTGSYKRKPRLNEYFDCGDYFELVIKPNVSSKIDKDDYPKVATGKWSYAKSVSYPIRIIKNKTVLLHHVILGKKKGYFVDHINGDRLDNRKNNLRFVTPQESACNRANMRGVYLSNYYKNRKEKKWVAHLIFKGVFHYLGIFDNEEEALDARRNAEIKYFGDFRRI